MESEIVANAATLPVETPARVDGRVVVRTRPGSRAAEQFRLLAARLEPIIAAGRKRIAVVSADRGDGRSTVAVNLALALGRRRRVALVEADLRAPSLHGALGLQPVHGLADVVAGRATLDQAIYRLVDVDFVPAGVTTAAHQVIGSPQVPAILAELGARYEAVIVDVPPVLQAADVPTLAPALDGALLVIRIGRSRRDRLARAAGRLPEGLLLGAVLAGAAE